MRTDAERIRLLEEALARVQRIVQGGEHREGWIAIGDIRASADFQVVAGSGWRFSFRGVQQADVIRALWPTLRGHPPMTVAQIRGRIGVFGSSWRLGKLFKKHPAWGRFIRAHGDGTYSLCDEFPRRSPRAPRGATKNP